MALIDELKQRRFEAQTGVRECEDKIDTYQRSLLSWTRRVNDLDTCIAALEPQHDEPQASSQPVTAEPLPSPGEGEESRDHSEGYAPVTDPEPMADPIWNEPEPEQERPNPFSILKREGAQ